MYSVETPHTSRITSRGIRDQYSRSVVPNFSGVVNSGTTTRTEVTEIIRQTDYTTGASYAVTGSNITFLKILPGANYTLTVPGA